MKKRCDKALNNLLADCRALATRARRLTRGAEPSERLFDDLRRAAAHVQMANDAMDSGPAGAVARGATRLAGRLARGGAKEPARMADAIASLRHSRPETSRHDFEGVTSSIPVPELLGFLNVQSKTGTLRVRLENEQISISLRRGELVYARSDNSPRGCRLGEILVRQGAMRAEELESFLVFHVTGDGPLGQALTVNDLVNVEQLEAALDQQLHELLARLFDAREARFAFRDGEIEEGAEDYGRSIVQLLLEGARVHDTNARGEEPEQPQAAPPPAGGSEGDLKLKSSESAVRRLPRRRSGH